MRSLKWFGALLILVTLTSCVSPFYGTAKIEPGFHVNAGVGVGQFVEGSYEATSRYIGPRADVEVGYAFSHFFKAHIRAGVARGWRSEEYVEGDSPPPRLKATLLDGAIGIQVSSPHHYPTPALRLEVGLGGGELGSDVRDRGTRMAHPGHSRILPFGRCNILSVLGCSVCRYPSPAPSFDLCYAWSSYPL